MYKKTINFILNSLWLLTFLYELDIKKVIDILFSLSRPVNLEGTKGQESPCGKNINNICFIPCWKSQQGESFGEKGLGRFFYPNYGG